MSERAFHLSFGAILIAALYFDLRIVIYGLIVWQAVEALTNHFLTHFVSRLRMKGTTSSAVECDSWLFIGADRALRGVLAMLLLLSYVLFNDQLWIVNWFVGFALLVAGLSGICPMRLALKRIGFR